MPIIIYIAIGLLIGLIGEKFLKKKKVSTLTCIVIAMVGSVLGGYAAWSLGYTSYIDKFEASFLMSILGGVLMILLSYLLITKS